MPVFHVVGLPSTRTSGKSECQFTALTGNFIRMMKSLGHKVIHYGVGCDEECEDVVVAQPVKMDWTGTASWWTMYNASVMAEINKRKQRGDFVCVINGRLNQALSAIADVMVVEFAIGYNGTFAKYRVFASYAHMHKVLGAEGGFDPDGKFYDAAIPHFVNPDNYPLQTKKSDYYLYVGRLIRRKGVRIAEETCKRLGAKLILAGAGVTKVEGKKIHCADGEVYEGEYAGFVTGEQRLKLYQNAIATFCPTQYVEPFNMTTLEAQMVGTPVLTTAWGSYPELVEHGKTGFRCHTLNEFVHAAKHVGELDAQYIRDRAIRLYSLDTVRWQYDTYFRRLSDLWGDGWYTLHDQVDEHWLRGAV